MSLQKIENLKSSSSSLADELNNVDLQKENKNLENEVAVLKGKMLKIKEYEKKRIEQHEKLEKLSKQKVKELEHLTISLKRIKPKEKPRCRFEWKCKRGAFCKFDHSYLYRKVNSHLLNSAVLMPITPIEQLCEVCGNIFVSLEDLQAHIENCQNSMSKSHENCSKCGKLFNSKQEMEEHVRNEHTVDQISDEVNKCSTCTKDFNTTLSLKMHMKMNHQAKPMEDQSPADVILDSQNFSCLLCNMDFLSIQQMDSHMDELHEGRWKLGDVIGEGDDSEEINSEYSDTESEEVHTSDDSKTEDSES